MFPSVETGQQDYESGGRKHVHQRKVMCVLNDASLAYQHHYDVIMNCVSLSLRKTLSAQVC